MSWGSPFLLGRIASEAVTWHSRLDARLRPLAALRRHLRMLLDVCDAAGRLLSHEAQASGC